MPKERHPELEGHESQPLYTFELKHRGQSLRNRMLWMFLGAGLGISLGLATPMLLSMERGLAPNVEAAADPFVEGSHQAMTAAELTQTAEFREEWSQIAILWQQAIAHMRSVPSSHSNYAIAQQKLQEYGRNLQYAQSNVNSRQSKNPNQQPFWTIGSDRELVLQIQGMPTRMIQYPSSCKEVMYYGSSIVELRNGYVANYSDHDNALKVLGDQNVALSFNPQPNTWTIGSSREAVFQVQGTPTRTTLYQNAITLHYGESIVQLMDNRVIGYSNTGNNLKVSLTPKLREGASLPTSWAMGASRLDVLMVEQELPTAVTRVDANCEEVFTFGDSTVKFRQGLVSEYSDSGSRLNFR